MYSPFRNEQGQPKELDEVTYADLAQLKELEEGFALEFKRTWNENVRVKVPKIIASFANSHGGWLIIGIADDDKAVCPIPKRPADFSQIFGELCRHHVFPTPRFGTRFIADPANPAQGVVVVQVYEGDFPPYVADGIVEIREGSSSGPALGSALVELYGKATKRAQEIREYCQRTVWYPADSPCSSRDGSAPEAPLPLFSLYLYRMGRHAADTPSRAAQESHVVAMRNAFAQQGMSCHVQHAHDSLIFRTSKDIPGSSIHSSIELFPDESMKLTVPGVMLDRSLQDEALRQIAQLGIEVPADARFIGATETLRRVTRMASLLDRYVRARAISWTNYAVAYELENMAGVMLWSETETYARYIGNHGLLFCGTTDCRSRIRYLDDGVHGSFRARQFAGSHFFEACGLPLGSPSKEDNELVDALLRGGKA